MASIDERVVNMRFNNNQFLEGIRSTLSALDNLKNKLGLSGASKGLQQVDAASKKLSFGPIGTQIEGINTKFLAMATIGVAALGRVATAAVDAGARLVKSFTVDPVLQGLQEYETNMNSIQTILANTQSKGTVLTDVTGALDELNTYADKTIYNFSEMARNIGTFTAAGVDLDTSVNAIKGIANLAAVSGSNSQQASTAMYQLSQALSTGRVSLMDWNSVVNAGMGGELFQNNILETARNHGVAVDDIIKKNGSFRDSLQEGWLSSEILTESLSKMTGDLTDQQLKSLGYSDEQIVKIQEMAKTASDAATKVKTFTQLMDTLKEAAGSGWAKSFAIVVGDFEEAKALFTDINDVLGGMLGAQADARNEMLQGWKDLGGRDALIKTFSEAFRVLLEIVRPIKEAFRDIFPAMTAQRLYDITIAIRDFVSGLKVSDEASENLKRTFRGVFAAIDIGIAVIQGILGVLGRLFGKIFEGSGTLLDFTGGVGDFIVSLRDAVRNGEGFSAFFDRIGDILVSAIDGIKNFASAIAGMFSGVDVDFGIFEGVLERVNQRLSPLEILGNSLKTIFGNLGTIFNNVKEAIGPLAEKLGEFLGGIGEAGGNAIQDVDYSSVLDTFNTGFLGVIALAIQNFLGGGAIEQLKGLFSKDEEGGGLVSNIKDSFGALTETLSAMQAQLKAKTLLAIAAAIGLLAAAVVAISLIDSEDLTKSLTAITIMFTQLLAATYVMNLIALSKGFLKMPFIAAAMVGMAAAVLILAGAVNAVADLSWEELAKGLTGIAGALGLLVTAALILSRNAGGMSLGAGGMVLIAGAVRILASAMKAIGELSWKEIAKGLVGIAGALTILVVAMKTMPGALAGAAAVAIVAPAIVLLAGVFRVLGAMSFGDIVKASIALASALGIIVVAMSLMPGALLGAAALVVVGGALLLVVPMFVLLGQMDWGSIAKASVALAAALAIIAGGMYLMVAALPGAAALLVVGAALMLVMPVFAALGQMTWGEIGKGLVALAGALVVLAAAGMLLTPAIPGLLGLGAAIALIGIGVGAAGAGLLALATALGLVAGAGAGAVAVVVGFVSALIDLIPKMMTKLAEGLLAFVTTIATHVGEFYEAGVKLVGAILDAIGENVPKAMEAMGKLIDGLAKLVEEKLPTFEKTYRTLMDAFLRIVGEYAPRIIRLYGDIFVAFVKTLGERVPEIVRLILKMMTDILNAIARQTPGLVTAGANIIIAFLRGIQNNMARVGQEGANTVIKFVNTVANTIRNNSGAMNAAGRNLASAIIQGMTSGLYGGAGAIATAARNVARTALNSAKSFLGINSPSKEFIKLGAWSSEGMANGLTNAAPLVKRASESVGADAIAALKRSMSNAGAVASALDVDIQPRVRPVLDLSDVRKGASTMRGLLEADGIRPDTSLRAASDIVSSRGQALLEAAREGTLAQQSPAAATIFNQYNTSPVALSAGEIYRQTKSQLSSIRKGK